MDAVTSTIASAIHSPKALLRLRGSINDMSWGKPGKSSLVAKLAGEGVGPDFSPDPEHTYAELWMGTHGSGPASIYAESVSRLPPLSSIVSLSSLIQAHPEHYLGSATLNKFPKSRDVPFLFKILSIAKALPLQAHPDKDLGAKLHNRNPAEFPDSNHKPEIAVSLGGTVSDSFGGGGEVAFTGFVGFRPLKDIADALRHVAELRHAVANDNAVNTFISAPSKEGLKTVYAALLSNGKENPKSVAEHVQALVTRIGSGGFGTDLPGANVLGRLVIKVNEQYNGDVGVFAVPFFMNLVRLKRGESIYIGADEIHAYLEGDIVECMAVSDNVVNSAFVPPEERDISTFIDMLTYTSREPSHWALPQNEFKRSMTGKTTAFKPPLEEFNVLWTQLGLGAETLGPSEGPTIGIVTKGSVRVRAGEEEISLPEGGIVFVAPKHEVTIQSVGSGEGEMWWATS